MDIIQDSFYHYKASKLLSHRLRIRMEFDPRLELFDNEADCGKIGLVDCTIVDTKEGCDI